MNGELAQLVALVSYGNAALSLGVDVDGFESTNSTFRFVRTLAFEVPDATTGTRTARSVVEWLDAARTAEVGRLSLWVGAEEEREPTAFVNQGNWAMVGHAPDRTYGWSGWWGVNDEDPPGPSRIWEVGYRLSVRDQPTVVPVVDLEAQRAELVEAVTGARTFAAEEVPYLQGFVTIFDETLALAEARSPQPAYHPDLLVPAGHPSEARRLLAMATKAWVFGGMGSWNDIGLPDGDSYRRYEAVSRRLYRAVLDSIAASVNAVEAP